MKDYSANVTYSTKELNKKQKIRIQQMGDVISINDIMENDKLMLDNCVALYAIDVHNEKADNKDYTVYVVEDAEGNLYKTGSESFFRNAQDIFEDFEDELEAGESISLLCYKSSSKNVPGGKFITCTIM